MECVEREPRSGNQDGQQADTEGIKKEEKRLLDKIFKALIEENKGEFSDAQTATTAPKVIFKALAKLTEF